MSEANRSSTQRLELFYRISLELSSSLNLDDVLGKVLSLTIKMLGASKGSIFLLDNLGRVVRRILARADLPPEDSRQVVAKVMDIGLAGWVYKHKKPTLITDTDLDPRWVTFPDDATTPRSALSVPLLRGQRVVGLLTMVHPEPNSFSASDLELASAIAGLAAVAVENARLFTQVSMERKTLAAVLRNVRSAIMVTDAESTILMLNPPASTILGVRMADAIGRPLAQVIDNPDLVALFRRAGPALAEPMSGEVRIGQQATYNASLAPVPGVGYAVALHDVSFLKRLDELKTESLAAVSHDLRGPLGVILGSAEMMARYTDVGEEQKEFIELISLTAERMRGLVERLLDLSRIESGQAMEWQVMPVAQTLEEVAREAEAQAQLKGVRFAADFAPDLPALRIDPLRLGQAVANLLNNAVKYTPAGGKVSLSAGVDDGRQAVLIQVADTGPGIPPEAMEDLFSKFFRVNAAATADQEGAGLGLAIVRSVVEAHGGRVWVESKPGQGSTFIIALPFLKKADA